MDLFDLTGVKDIVDFEVKGNKDIGVISKSRIEILDIGDIDKILDISRVIKKGDI